MEVLVIGILAVLAFPLIIAAAGIVLGLLGGAIGLFAGLVAVPFALLFAALGVAAKIALPLIVIGLIFAALR